MTKKLIIIFISILIYGCNNTDINDKDKRNENWVYWIDKKTGEASWIPVGDKTTIKDGNFTSFYKNGNIYQKGKLKNGKRIDTIYDYNLNNNLLEYEIVKPDTLLHYYINDGPYISYLQNGKILEKGNVENHKIGNEWTKYYDNDKIKWTKKITHGTGWYRWYYDNGQISDSNYHLNGKTHGEVKTWYKNGQIKEISHWKNGLQNGLFEFFYENGKLEERTNWLIGKPEKTESWYENGQNKNIKFYKAGLINGNYKQWYSSGNIKMNVNFSLGRKDGKATVYHENGNLQTEQYYKNDQQNGIFIWYDENGKVIKKVTYVDGKIVDELK